MINKKLTWPTISWLFLMPLLFNSCITGNDKSDSRPYIGTWTAQTERFYPEINSNITLNMDLSIMENGNYVAAGKARLSQADPEFTIFSEMGSWHESGSKIEFSAMNCAYHDGEGLAVAPCQDPITVIEIIIEGQVWTWVEPDGFTINFVFKD